MLLSADFFQNLIFQKIISGTLSKCIILVPGPVAQSVKNLIADPGVVSWIPALSHTFVEIDHAVVFTVILLLLPIQGGLLIKQSNVCAQST